MPQPEKWNIRYSLSACMLAACRFGLQGPSILESGFKHVSSDLRHIFA